MLNKVQSCEVCDNKDIETVLDLGNHPLCDDLIVLGDNRISEEFPIEIALCGNCLTAHQVYQIPKKKLFSYNYHYRSRMTGSVLSGMSDLVDNCEKHIGNLNGKKVVDIGSNDGSLLNYFMLKGCLTLGVEPTEAALDADHFTLNKFFDQSTANLIVDKIGKPDIVTFTNVFAHIENLSQLIEDLKLLLHSNTIVVIENHYLGAVLDKGQFDTFYHEHPRSYSFKSFEYIADKLNLFIQHIEFVERYGGNIRVFLGKKKIKYPKVDESRFKSLFIEMNIDLNNWIDQTSKKIRELVKKFGPLRAKAFPGRAAILIKLLNLNESQISAVYEIKGSIKINHYVPGTRIPILPEAQLYKLDNLKLPILNLAWHIPAEVRANLKKNNYEGEVIDIKD